MWGETELEADLGKQVKTLTAENESYKKNEKRMEHDHELALEKKDFEMEHLERKKIKEKEGEVIELTKQLAVAEEKIEMMEKIVDLNADLVDVKDLINSLIEKLPEFKINTLQLTGGQNGKVDE